MPKLKIEDVENNREVRRIIKRHGLTRKEAAELLGVSLHTIHSWLRPEDSKNFRFCPRSMLELLELKVRR